MTCRANSLRNAERILRGKGEKFVIKNPDIRIPANFHKFLGNGGNNERLFELIEEVWNENEGTVAEKTIYSGRGNSCKKKERDDVQLENSLTTSYEKEGTKTAYMIQHAQENNVEEKNAYLAHLPSADIDIPLILLRNNLSEDEAYNDSDTGKHRKIINLLVSSLTGLQKKDLASTSSQAMM